MRSNRRVLAALLAGCVIAAAACAVEIPLIYERFSDDPDESAGRGFVGRRYLPETHTRPEGEWKLPALLAKKPFYQLLKLGDREHLLVLDQQTASDESYTRLYFDANANRDLTDDAVIDGRAENGYKFFSTAFAPVDVNILIDGQPFPYSFRIEAERFEPGGFTSLLLRAASLFTGGSVGDFTFAHLWGNCCYKGEMELDGKKYTVRLVDDNLNGRFDDRLRAAPEGADPATAGASSSADELYLTTADYPGGGDAQALGDVLVVGKSVLQFDFDLAKKMASATPLTEGLARLRLPDAPTCLSLCSADGKETVMMFRPDSVVSVPAGAYRLANYRIQRKDEGGNEWVLQAEAGHDAPVTQATRDTETVLPFGEPYSPGVSVDERDIAKVQLGGRKVTLDLTIEGTGKEVVTYLRRVKGEKNTIPMSAEDDSRPKEATYKVLKADGEVVAQGSFEYG